jgi:endonuclease YncB( thermonuclease family)
MFVGEVDRIVDGDTLYINLDLGFGLTLDEDIRLADIDAPEHSTFVAAGMIDPALNYLQQKLPQGAMVVVETKREEKFGRWLATLHYLMGCTDPQEILANGTIINDELVALGYAKHYEGGKK